MLKGEEEQKKNRTQIDSPDLIFGSETSVLTKMKARQSAKIKVFTSVEGCTCLGRKKNGAVTEYVHILLWGTK